jgi:hypothetical protein
MTPTHLPCLPRAAAQVPVFSSCGGIGSSGPSDEDVLLGEPVCCPLESSCKKYNEYFYQCMPDDYTPSSTQLPPQYDAACASIKVGACSRACLAP